MQWAFRTAQRWTRIPVHRRYVHRVHQSVSCLPRTVTANRCSTMAINSTFAGQTCPELQQWLEKHGVDTSCYGQGLAKNVADLLEEQTRLESVLDVVDGQALRVVRVLSLHIVNDQGQVLFEEEQILPDGRSRKRHVAVSEKLVGAESWRAAVSRAVQEELSEALPPGYQIELLEDTYRLLEEYASSMSYPGLRTKYIFHRVSAKLPGLPTGPFETREPRPGGALITRWAWRYPDSEKDGLDMMNGNGKHSYNGNGKHSCNGNGNGKQHGSSSNSSGGLQQGPLPNRLSTERE